MIIVLYKDILISYIFLCNFFNLSLLNKIKKKIKVFRIKILNIVILNCNVIVKIIEY